MAQADIKNAVSQVFASVQSDPGTAKLVYKADTQWEEDVRCTANVRNFDPLVIDEPPTFGGGDTGMSPVELALAALGSCQEIMYVALGSMMDIPLDSVKVKLTGHLDLHGLLGLGADKNIPPGFHKIQYETRIESSAGEEDLKRLVDAVESQCPLLDMLQRPVDVSGKAIINDKTEYVAGDTKTQAAA